MHKNCIDMTGQRYGRLEILSRDLSKKNTAYWNCKCDCGRQKSIRGSHIRNGLTRSCGCFHLEMLKIDGTTHGMSRTKTYNVWINMIERCTNPKARFYARYGGRGILVCNEWMESFESFYADMGECPQNMQIDRIDNDSGYNKNNCRWTTAIQNSRNRSTSRIINGRSLAEWSDISKINSATIAYRIDKCGWTLDRALRTPLRKSTPNSGANLERK